MIVSVDYGQKRCGVAWGESNPSSSTVVPKEELAEFLRELKPDVLVFGLPLSMSGRYSCQTFTVIEFAEKVRFSLGKIPVFLVDERLSTKMAHSILKETKSNVSVDAVSASLILENYLRNPEAAFMMYDELPKLTIPKISAESVLIHEVCDPGVLDSIEAKRLDVLQSDPYVAYLFKKRVRFVERMEQFLEGDYDIILSSKPDRVKDLLKRNGEMIRVKCP